jgi:uncharacterized protein
MGGGTLENKPYILAVKVIPQAPRNCVVGMEAGLVRIKLKAPPVDGKANEALVDFLAAELEIPRRNIFIRTGHSSRRKLVVIEGCDPQRIEKFCLAADTKKL